jgi:type 1 glutamine amidotransferase
LFYCSLGHVASVLEIPEVATIMRRGMVWGAR